MHGAQLVREDKVGVSLSQILAEDVLELTMVTPSSVELLERVIRWVAPIELRDPAPFLRGGELVLTTGALFDVAIPQVWDGYVNRILHSGATAIGFSASLIHPQIPRALLDACVRYGMPLLSVPIHISFIRVNEFVADLIVADRFKDVRRAGDLAAQLAHAISNGAPPAALLQQIAEEINGAAAILDIDGGVVATWPTDAEWPSVDILQALTTTSSDGYLSVALDQAGAYDHILVAHSLQTDKARLAIASAATLVAIDLNTRLREESSSASRMKDVVDALTDWTTPAATLTRLLRVAGLGADVPTVVILAHPGSTYSPGYSLRLRLAAQLTSPIVRSVRFGELLLLLAQGEADGTEDVLETFLRVMPGRRIVVAGPAHDAEEIRMVFASAQMELSPDQNTPKRARAFHLTSIVAASAGRGGQRASKAFLNPLVDHDERHGTELVATLRAYLRSDGKPIRAAKMLYIHRNTLRYRTEQVSRLLSLDLDTLDALLICELAFRLHDMH